MNVNEYSRRHIAAKYDLDPADVVPDEVYLYTIDGMPYEEWIEAMYGDDE